MLNLPTQLDIMNRTRQEIGLDPVDNMEDTQKSEDEILSNMQKICLIEAKRTSDMYLNMDIIKRDSYEKTIL